jgi:hypothetical protein
VVLHGRGIKISSDCVFRLKNVLAPVGDAPAPCIMGAQTISVEPKLLQSPLKSEFISDAHTEANAWLVGILQPGSSCH